MVHRRRNNRMDRPDLVQAFALAIVLATGCGGSSAAGESPADSADDGASSAENAGHTTSPGVEPAGADPAPSLPIGAAPADPPPAAAAASPQPTEVLVTSDTVQLGTGEGLLASPLFIARSPLGTTLELVEASERICVRGGLAAVPDEDYPNYWGGEVGLVLGTTPPTDVAPPGEGLNARGFAFRLSGELPLQLRLRVGAAGEVPLTSQYCQNVPTNLDSSVEIALQSLTFECWGFDGAPYPESASATLVSWQIPANLEAASQFDFCIEDIRALP